MSVKIAVIEQIPSQFGWIHGNLVYTQGAEDNRDAITLDAFAG